MVMVMMMAVVAMMATWQRLLYAIQDGTSDRALTEILRKFQDIQDNFIFNLYFSIFINSETYILRQDSLDTKICKLFSAVRFAWVVKTIKFAQFEEPTFSPNYVLLLLKSWLKKYMNILFSTKIQGPFFWITTHTQGGFYKYQNSLSHSQAIVEL